LYDSYFLTILFYDRLVQNLEQRRSVYS